ncbi:MAG: signal peptide peptidase SppA [Prevotellaceae bacterium]|jgi:protease-4|nr:signal peptide peptidase SppA [Prevotellaceae bacterium]
MKTFLKMLLASILGFGLILTVLIFIVLSALKQPVEVIGKNSILKISLARELDDRAGLPKISLTGMKIESKSGLNNLLFALEQAKYDERIRGIYLELSQISAGIASVEEIREALVSFKRESGKYVLAYAETYSQKAYYLATVADRIYLNPFGSIQIKGLSVEMMLYKKLLDKLGVDVQIIRHGKFKSAVEPFMLDRISDENREQIMGYVGSIWLHVLQTISQAREIDIDELNKIADNLELAFAGDALEKKLVDKLMYEDEVLSELQKYALTTPNIIDIETYYTPSDRTSDSHIAVVYASGDIMTGDGDSDIMTANIMRTLAKVRSDSSVKAVVFRVNSPGGSADASEFIARELELTRQKKPVVVSMGNVAASGGYWISLPANAIFANRTTLTGSIGVFGMIPNFGKVAEEKLGITFDAIITNKHADFPSVVRPLTAVEQDYLQKSVDNIYFKFAQKVAGFRKMSELRVDSIAQGRVWSGVDALNIGLIDYFGGLTTAIEEAARLAQIDDYTLLELPREPDPIDLLLKSFEAKISTTRTSELAGFVKQYEQIVNRLKNYGILAKLPYELIER